MKILLLLAVFISSYSVAESGLQEVVLTPSLAKSLGFSILVTTEGTATIIELEGPNKSSSGCPAARSGSFLLDSNGEELFVYITEISEKNIKPKTFGYYKNRSHSMGIFIDYLCKNKKMSQSIRYTVSSISNWLIARQ